MMTDAFICDYIRTPIGRYGGALAPVRADDLAAVPLAELLRRNPDMDPAAIEEVWMGCANQAGEDNRNVARMALLLAGLPDAVPGVTVNRLCGSGLEAVAAAAPSFTPEALPAVIDPSVRVIGRSFASCTIVVSRGCSSCTTSIGSLRPCGTVTATISSANRPDFCAADARACDRRAQAS